MYSCWCKAIEIKQKKDIDGCNGDAPNSNNKEELFVIFLPRNSSAFADGKLCQVEVQEMFTTNSTLSSGLIIRYYNRSQKIST